MEWFFEMYFVIYNNGFRFVAEEPIFTFKTYLCFFKSKSFFNPPKKLHVYKIVLTEVIAANSFLTEV